MRLKAIFITVFMIATQSVYAASAPRSYTVSLEIPKVITRCEVPAEISESSQYVKLDIPVQANQTMAGSPVSLTLIRQEGKYDVLIGGDSIGKGGELMSAYGGINPVHLILSNDTGIEHLLFDLNLDGSGDLLWSSATMSALTTCDSALAHTTP